MPHKIVSTSIPEAIRMVIMDRKVICFLTCMFNCLTLVVHRHIIMLMLVQEEEVYMQRSAGVRQELEAMRAAATQFDALHRAAAAEVARLKEAQAVEQGQAHMLLKQGAALKWDNHLLKVILHRHKGGVGGYRITCFDSTKGAREQFAKPCVVSAYRGQKAQCIG